MMRQIKNVEKGKLSFIGLREHLYSWILKALFWFLIIQTCISLNKVLRNCLVKTTHLVLKFLPFVHKVPLHFPC